MLDLKPLIRCPCVPKFQMKLTRSVIVSLGEEEFLALADIQDAHLHILIFPLHQCFVCFAVGDHYHRGWSLHPDFTKALALLFCELRTLISQVIWMTSY